MGRENLRIGASLRNDLYMPALVAARFNPDLKAKYELLIDAGKSPKSP
jgi:transposase